MNDVTCYDFSAVTDGLGIDTSQLSNREKIELMEWHLKTTGIGSLDGVETGHLVHGGLYARTMKVKAGMLVIGKVHLKDHVCFLTKGDISVMTDEGMMRVEAPFSLACKAGIKRIGLAHTDTEWVSVHLSNLTDIKELEDELTIDSDLSWVGKFIGQQKQVAI